MSISTYFAPLTETKTNKKEKKEINPKLKSAIQAMIQTAILNGTYTITSPKSGDHVTISIDTCLDENSFFYGKRIVSMLIGQNNETDYCGFGELREKELVIWQSVLQEKKPVYTLMLSKVKDWSKFTKSTHSLLIKGNESPFAKLGMTILVSTTCLLCNRKLTHPSSVNRCLGADCAKKVA